MATPRSFSNYKASSDNRRSRTAFKADLIVASPGGISPPGAPRTVREPLDSHGSRWIVRRPLGVVKISKGGNRKNNPDFRTFRTAEGGFANSRRHPG